MRAEITTAPFALGEHLARCCTAGLDLRSAKQLCRSLVGANKHGLDATFNNDATDSMESGQLKPKRNSFK